MLLAWTITIMIDGLLNIAFVPLSLPLFRYDKFFMTFESRPGDIAQAEPHAHKALILYSSAPDLYGSELLERAAVMKLKNSSNPDFKAVFRLVEVFLKGTVDEMIAFLKLPEGSKALSICELSQDMAMDKCRVLNLMALPTGRLPTTPICRLTD